MEATKSGHVIIVPNSNMRNSLTEFITNKTVTKRETIHFKQDVPLKEWSVSLTEIASENVC